MRTGLVPGLSDVMWDDIRVAPEITNLGGTGPASVDTFRNGVRALKFAASTDDSCWFEVQMPHGFHQYTGAYSLKPHVHWSVITTTATGTLTWGLEYTWANPSLTGDSAFPATSTLEATYTFAANKQYAHVITPLGSIDITNMAISAVILCRFYRKGTTDTFADAAFAVSIDFHYPLNAPGSVGEYTKGQ